MTLGEIAEEMESTVVEAALAMDLLVQRSMYRDANVQMAAVQAATGNGRIPKQWFRAVTETDDQADKLAFEINSERLARRLWGNKKPGSGRK